MHSIAVPSGLAAAAAAAAAAAIQPKVPVAVHARLHLPEASHPTQTCVTKPHQRTRHALQSAAAAAAAASSHSAGPFTAAPISGQHPSYGGPCTVCGASHSLNCSDASLSALQHVLAMITEHQHLDYESRGPADPRFAIDYLFTKGPGRMLGVLLAVDAEGKQHILKAFSGQITKCWYIPGWVGPVAGIINESPLYVKTRKVIEGMSARMHALEEKQQQQHRHQQQLRHHHHQHQPQQQQQQQQQVTQADPYLHPPQQEQRQHRNSGHISFEQQQRQLLKKRRRCLSHHLLQQIQHSYCTCTAAGQSLSLLDVYLAYRDQHDPSVPVTQAGQGFVGMPAGVGDCCAPKLLHAACQQGLQPVSMCEVWFGSGPGTATKAKQGRPIVGVGLDPSSSRQHCRLYGPCEKCCAILGTMLCPEQQVACV